MEDVARHVTLPVAVIGGGWAGCAAAVTLAANGVPVVVYEAAAMLGGRARRVERDGMPLDNGQHLLLGAYTETLALLQTIRFGDGGTLPLARRRLSVTPFAERDPDALALTAYALPGRLGLLAGMLLARGLTWRERLANVRWFRQLERTGFTRPAGETVATLLSPLPARVTSGLWAPLCLAALNTPVEEASAQVFANVLRGAFAGPGRSSDFLIPLTDLGALLPDAASHFVTANGGRCVREARAQVVGTGREGVMLAVHGQAVRAAAVIVAVGPHQLPRVFASEAMTRNPAMAAAIDTMQALDYEPIVTVWLGYPTTIALQHGVARLDDAPGQWVFAREDVLQRAVHARGRPRIATLLSVVISARGAHLPLSHAELAQRVDAQLRRLRPGLAPCVWSWVVAERRATYACKPGRARPAGPRLAPGVFLAGDYVDAEYPATLEAAVRSGTAAARALLDERA